MWYRNAGVAKTTVKDLATELAKEFKFNAKQAKEVISGEEAKSFYSAGSPSKSTPNLERATGSNQSLTPLHINLSDVDVVNNEVIISNSNPKTPGIFSKLHSKISFLFYFKEPLQIE